MWGHLTTEWIVTVPFPLWKISKRLSQAGTDFILSSVLKGNNKCCEYPNHPNLPSSNTHHYYHHQHHRYLHKNHHAIRSTFFKNIYIFFYYFLHPFSILSQHFSFHNKQKYHLSQTTIQIGALSINPCKLNIFWNVNQKDYFN